MSEMYSFKGRARNIGPREDMLFNVRVNGVDVAHNLTRTDAEHYLGKGLGFVQIYLSHKPLEGRRAAWSKASLPRVPSLYTSEKSRAKALANVLADPAITVEVE